MNRDDSEKLHTSVLVAPASENRHLRKQRRKAAKNLQLEQRAEERATAHTKYEAERDERRGTTYLPQAGDHGAAQLRSPGRFKIPRHQDTSATLAGAYPFLAEGGLGSDGVFVGQDLYSGGSCVYDPWVLYARGHITAPNLVLAGIVGSGKSSLAKSLYTRSLPFGRRVYVPGDPKGEHTAVAEAVGGRAIVLGHGLSTRLNPLDEGYRPTGMSVETWTSTVAARRRDLIGALAEAVLDRPLTPLEHTAIDTALTETVTHNDVPILPMVVDHILQPNHAVDPERRLAEDGRLVGHALRRLVAGDLAGLFDGLSTTYTDARDGLDQLANLMTDLDDLYGKCEPSARRILVRAVCKKIVIDEDEHISYEPTDAVGATKTYATQRKNAGPVTNDHSLVTETGVHVGEVSNFSYLVEVRVCRFTTY